MREGSSIFSLQSNESQRGGALGELCSIHPRSGQIYHGSVGSLRYPCGSFSRGALSTRESERDGPFSERSMDADDTRDASL